MHKFWTVTDGDTTHTNSRSSKYGTPEGALAEATRRIENGRAESVFILEAVRIVRKKQEPIEVIEI